MPVGYGHGGAGSGFAGFGGGGTLVLSSLKEHSFLWLEPLPQRGMEEVQRGYSLTDVTHDAPHAFVFHKPLRPFARLMFFWLDPKEPKNQGWTHSTRQFLLAPRRGLRTAPPPATVCYRSCGAFLKKRRRRDGLR